MKNMDIPSLYKIYLQHNQVSTDTRMIKKDSLFFALKGERFNGNDFAMEALQKGASYAVVDNDRWNGIDRIIRVHDTLQSLQQLAAYHREQSVFNILAITGSNGKTTTKELCRAVLSEKYKVSATEGNLNNHIGVPLTILSMESKTETGIVEMGANHPGEITLLCDIVKPDYGLITNIGKAHLEGFGSIEGVARAKGELFDHLMEHDKTLIINEGDAYINKMVQGHYDRVLYYNGTKGIFRSNVSNSPFVEFDALLGKKRLHFRTGIIGRYNIENILAAC